MELADLSVQVHPGDGLVARYETALLVVLPAAADQESAVEELAALVSAGVAEYGPQPGRRLLRSLASRLVQVDPHALPALALVATAEQGLALLVSGSAEVTVRAEGSTRTYRGDEAATWVDLLLTGSVVEVQIRAGTGPTPGRPRGPLLLGTVPGGGATLTAAGVPAAGDPGVAAAEPRAADDAVADATPAPGAAVPRGADDPVADATPAPGADESADLTPTKVQPAVRDDAADLRLVLDDGSSVVLDRDYVIGRDPEEAAEVSVGQTASLRLSDPDRSISRAHARIERRGADLRLVDAGSANGTFHAGATDTGWTRLVAGTPVPLGPGSRILIGGRTLIVQAGPDPTSGT